MGSLNDLVLSLCMFWSGIHVAKYLVDRMLFTHSSRELTRSRAVLPLDRQTPSKALSFSNYVSHKAVRAFLKLQINISLKAANLRIETTALNATFDRVSTQIVQAPSRPYASGIKHVSAHFYSLGAGLGLFGMALGYMLLLWSCLTVLPNLGSKSSPQPAEPVHADNDELSSTDSYSMAGTGLAVQPIIPGVTVPLSHLPILLGALLLSQIVHEAGHAITAIIEGVPIHSVGVGLFVCLPSAFVALGSTAFDRLPPIPRMRIATAGAYHNIVLWLTIAALSWLGIGEFLIRGWTGWGTPLGPYKLIDNLGVSVRSIEQDSELGNYLFPGDIITHIEDTVLAQAHLLSRRRTPLQLWHDLLLHHHWNVTIEDLPDMGWCVDTKWYEAQPTSCCTETSASSLVCFSHNVTTPGRCLDPFKIFEPPETPMALVHGRCATKCITSKTALAEDEPDQVCIRAKGIIRIGVLRNGQERQTVLWSGPSEEIWEQVRVEDIAPRYWFVPLGLPEVFTLLASYTSTITLSLYFLNLLPIRHLDGEQILGALLDVYAPKPSSLIEETIPLGQLTPSIEEGTGYPLNETVRPRVRRQTTPSAVHSITHPRINGGWISKHRAEIERTAELAAIGLILTVSLANTYILSIKP